MAPYVQDRVPLPSMGTIALLLGLTLLVVAVGSLAPARRAARMSPTDAIQDW
ncbi:hypothetical protein [Streptomyces gobiensis]|uniref:hypothetical protein n=1 Tax=Streptomyces gobiensis TaxID=2875706 RepID=UPI001E57948C|nr:hypothetical protein [Streptomyces gobiensis]UGY92804.1 hypothetical protein test1122_14510 [Streptomyces gobiensis]